MTDELSLAGLSATALTEGVKFLYQQADELPQRRRTKKNKVPEVVSEPRSLPPADPDRVAAFETDLAQLADDLRKRLPEHGSVSTEDRQLLLVAEALRRVLGAVYDTRIVFSGERQPSVHGAIVVDEVAGYAAAVRADLAAGRVTATAHVRRVEAGGEVIGVDLGSRD